MSSFEVEEVEDMFTKEKFLRLKNNPDIYDTWYKFYDKETVLISQKTRCIWCSGTKIVSFGGPNGPSTPNWCLSCPVMNRERTYRHIDSIPREIKERLYPTKP